MMFLEFDTKTQFTKTNLSYEWFIETHNNLKSDQNNWKIIKGLLLHKDCPVSLKEAYVNDPIWWKRIPALLSKKSWKQYLSSAIKDPKSTVRQAAYKRAIAEPSSVDVISVHDLFWLIRADVRVHNYFNKEFIKVLVSADKIEDLIAVYEIKKLLKIGELEIFG